MRDYAEDWEVEDCIGKLLNAIEDKISVFNDFTEETNSQITLGAWCYRNGKIPVLNIESENMRLIKKFNSIGLSLSVD
ncbi:MAG: DUF4279 domain-containing protein [Clostridiales bacterium]|jgi:hypothetical protein|nr:DUF4279 domain-containing protein [Clostridiales bacterium]